MNEDSVSAEKENANKQVKEEGTPLCVKRLGNWAEIQMLAKIRPISTSSEIFMSSLESPLGPFDELIARRAYELGMANMFHMVWLCMGDMGCDHLYGFIEDVNEGLLSEDFEGDHLDKSEPRGESKVFVGTKRAIQAILDREQDDEKSNGLL